MMMVIIIEHIGPSPFIACGSHCFLIPCQERGVGALLKLVPPEKDACCPPLDHACLDGGTNTAMSHYYRLEDASLSWLAKLLSLDWERKRWHTLRKWAIECGLNEIKVCVIWGMYWASKNAKISLKKKFAKHNSNILLGSDVGN